MNILEKVSSYFQGQKQVVTDVAKKSASTLSSIMSMRGSTAGIRSNTYGNITSWVFFALNKIALRISSVDFELYMYKSTDIVEVMDHEILALLDNPNPFQSGTEFKYILGFNLVLWGRAPIALIRDGNKVVAMGTLRPDLLKAITNAQGEVVSYDYKVGNNGQQFRAEDVIDIKIPNAYDHRQGASAVLSAYLEIDADMSTAVWNKHLIENGAQPSGVLETDKVLTDATFARLKAEWQTRYGGAENAGKMAILEAGLKYHTLSTSPKELDYIETRKFNRESILTLLGVPVSLVFSENVNKANAETAERVFARETIEPLVTFISGGMNAKLVPAFDDSLWIEAESVIPQDREEMRLDAQAYTNTSRTVNEIRKMDGLPPLEGGDVLYLPFSLTPTMTAKLAKGDAVEGTPAGMIEMRLDTKKRVFSAKELRIQKGVLSRTHRKRALVRKVSDDIYKSISAKAKASGKEVEAKKFVMNVKASEGDDLSPAIKADRIQYLESKTRLENVFRKSMEQYFSELKDEVVKNFVSKYEKSGGVILDVKAIEDIVLFDANGNIKKVQQRTRPLYQENIGKGATDVATLLAVKPSNFVETHAVQEFLMDKPTALAEQINDTTLTALRSTLAEGVGQGEDMTSLVNRISEVFDQASGYRAEMIARTEVGGAQNFGRAVEMQEQGVSRRQWISVFSNTRDSHADAHGQIVAVDEAFNVGGEDLMYPQDPDGSAENIINCQCSVVPLLDA